MQTKQEIRKKIISMRKSMSIQDVNNKSNIICSRIMESEIYQKSSVVYLYSSINNEVILEQLISDCLKNNKTIAFPKVKGKEIDFFTVKNIESLIAGSYGILEPVSDVVAPKADLIIVPGVAFTLDKKRLGYGGGYYDRYLEKHSAYTIGVCYDFQILPNLPTEKYDKVLNDIIFA